jgi:glycosyltransferase involved in cell wall biosynthesis
MNKQPVSLVLIAHNEAGTITNEAGAFYQHVVEKLPGSEMIISEDGSTDGTDRIVRGLASSLPARLIQAAERKGYARAFLDAIRSARSEWVFFSDTGGKFSPEDFWRLEKWRNDAELIIGLRKHREDQVYRRVMTSLFNLAVRCYFQVPAHDIDSGFRLFRRDIFLRAIEEPLCTKEMISTEITLRLLSLGARLREVPVAYAARKGQSRGMPLRKIPGIIAHILSSFPRLKKDMHSLREQSISLIC